ncbi:hypothetical protein L1887_52046 [Cichorium endivia]|nr:hypothetical protein L1887_52046 [Cichorium endivia]
MTSPIESRRHRPPRNPKLIPLPPRHHLDRQCRDINTHPHRRRNKMAHTHACMRPVPPSTASEPAEPKGNGTSTGSSAKFSIGARLSIGVFRATLKLFGFFWLFDVGEKGPIEVQPDFSAWPHRCAEARPLCVQPGALNEMKFDWSEASIWRGESG